MCIDAIVAGAGIWGCTVARRLAEAGKRVLVLEKRTAVGGNCRCEIDPENGIEVHTYGSHIFHTSDEEVWKFVTRFTEFNDYRHCVLAKTKKTGREKIGVENRCTADGKKVGQESRSTADGVHLYHLPIGCTLLKEFFGREIKPSEMTDDERTQLFDAFIRGYTSKQWGVAPEKVDPSIIARLKVRDNYSTDYFDDPYQGIPADGYNKMFERMLEHENITVQCGCALRVGRLEGWKVVVEGKGAEWINPYLQTSKPLNIYYSGPIDALFNYKYGALPWRTLRFERETLPVADYQGNSVVNYTDVDVPFTRIHEFKHYHPECSWGSRSLESKSKRGSDSVHSSTSTFNFNSSSKTIVMREYSATWQQGDEPYYPIDNAESRALLACYQAEVDRFNSRSLESKSKSGIDGVHSSTSTSNFNLVLGGRLGGYKYFDMDKSIAAALKVDLV